MMQANGDTLGFLVHNVARLLRKRFEQHARRSGLTRSQWQVLAYLNENKNIHQSALAEMIEVGPVTLGRIVDRLQAMGLVRRYPHPTDRRIWLLQLSPAALPKLTIARELSEITRSEALEGISAAEVESLIRTLQTLRTNLIYTCDMPVARQKK